MQCWKKNGHGKFHFGNIVRYKFNSGHSYCPWIIWQHDIIYFTDANTCTATAITHGRVVPDDDPIPIDTELEYICDPGYHLSTTSYTVVCSSDTDNGGNTASLVGTPPTCGKIALMIMMILILRSYIERIAAGKLSFNNRIAAE